MKLTKGALTMLLAQYRAIYKNAFIKGLASAALATAVLASGSASAAKTELPGVVDGNIIINEETVLTDKDTAVETTGATKLDIQSGGTLEVKGAQKASKLNITTNEFTVGDGGNFKLTGAAANSGATVKVTSNTVNLGGTTTLSDNSVLNFEKDSGIGQITANGTINNKGKITLKNYVLDLSNATYGKNGATVSATSSVIGLNDNAELITTGAKLDSLKESHINLNKDTSKLTINNTADKAFALDDQTFLATGANTAGIQVTAGTIKTNFATIAGAKAVANAGSLKFITDNLTYGADGTAAVSGSTIGATSGGIFVQNKLTVTGGADDSVLLDNIHLQNATAEGGKITGKNFTLGKDNVADGTLSIEKGVWTSEVDLTLGNDGNPGTAVKAGIITIGSTDAKLKAFAKDATLKFAEGKGITFATGTMVNKITVQEGAKLELLNESDIKNKANATDVIDIKTGASLKTTKANLDKLLTGKLGVTSSGDAVSTIEVTDETLELKASDFAATDGAAGLTLKGTLKGKNLKVSSDNDVAAVKAYDKDNAVLDFDSVALVSGKQVSSADAPEATFDKGTMRVANALSVTNAKGDKKGALTLGATSNASAKVFLENNTAGKLDVSKLNITNDSALYVTGTWSLVDNATIAFGTGNGSITVNENSALKGKDITLTSASDGSIDLDGKNTSLTVQKITATGAGGLNIYGGGKLILTANGTDDKGYLSIENGKIAINDDSSFVIQNKALTDLVKVDKGVATVDAMAGKISTTGNSEVVLDYAAGTKLSKDFLKKVTDGFKSGGNTFTGFINFGNAELSDSLTVDNNHFKWADYKDIANNNLTTNVIKNAVADVTKADATKGVYGSMGAINTTEALDKDGKVKLSGSTVLSNAGANGGKFVSANGSLVDVTVGNNSTLSLHNGGNVKGITLDATESNLIIKGGNTVVDGKIEGATSAPGTGNKGLVQFLSGNTTVKDTVNIEAFKAENANVNAKYVKLNVNKDDVTESKISNSTVNVNKLDLTIANALANKESVFTIKDNGTLVVDGTKGVNDADGTLVLTDTKGVISIGHEQDKKDINDTEASSNGALFVRDSSKLNGTVKLESGVEKASIAVYASEIKPATITPAEQTQKPKAAPIAFRAASGTPGAQNPDIIVPSTPSTPVAKDNATYYLQHTDEVGTNAAAVYGYNSIDEFVSDMKMANLMTEKDGIKDGRAIAVLNTETKLKDSTTGNTDKGSIVLGDVTSIKPTSGVYADGTVYLGDKSAIVVTDEAFGAKKDRTALTVKANGVEIAQNDDKSNKDTKVILTGAFTAKDSLQVFNNGAIKEKDTLALETANGMLVGTIDKTGKTTLGYNDKFDRNAVFYKASYPIRDYLVGMGKGEVKNVIEDKAQAQKDEMTKFTQGLTSAVDGGLTLEQASRFAVYGGSVKAAELASKTGTDAIKSYTKGTANVATAQTATGSIFVVPTYKSSDSDSFNAEGVDFGSDIKLSGVALGADYMVAPNMKVGGILNIGKGDADGKGIATGLETDLDYVGGGFFLNYNQEALNVTADITYTQSSADIKGDVATQGNYNKMTADVDTKAISLGVQGSYKFDLDGSYATPYAGVRVTKYDLDDYTVQLDGNNFVANTFDSMTVFSIPVGVELGTQMTAGDWTVEPSLDLGVTFNLGDTDLTHSATAVTKTSGVNLTSEVLDDVVFGIKGALKANYNGLSLGLGLGYEVGSNADDLSVQATGVYTF